MNEIKKHGWKIAAFIIWFVVLTVILHIISGFADESAISVIGGGILFVLTLVLYYVIPTPTISLKTSLKEQQQEIKDAESVSDKQQRYNDILYQYTTQQNLVIEITNEYNTAEKNATKQRTEANFALKIPSVLDEVKSKQIEEAEAAEARTRQLSDDLFKESQKLSELKTQFDAAKSDLEWAKRRDTKNQISASKMNQWSTLIHYA